MTLIETTTHRDTVRAQIGRKTPDEILEYAQARTDFHPEHRDWLRVVAERLRRSGYLTLADVTDDEFDSITE